MVVCDCRGNPEYAAIIIRSLLRDGTDVSLVDQDGRSPQSCANKIRLGCPNVYELISNTPTKQNHMVVPSINYLVPNDRHNDLDYEDTRPHLKNKSSTVNFATTLAYATIGITSYITNNTFQLANNSASHSKTKDNDNNLLNYIPLMILGVISIAAVLFCIVRRYCDPSKKSTQHRHKTNSKTRKKIYKSVTQNNNLEAGKESKELIDIEFK